MTAFRPNEAPVEVPPPDQAPVKNPDQGRPDTDLFDKTDPNNQFD